ncbi:MAG TPA: 2-amino-4-hydroxy-6-hydroxymethyldihydropteridine diphosphokinase [Streptosporangiaceae bacterium]|jgi:2-amino-4-hydroxy-6-hydroxymethyldihydropteridine diphosphokinase
MTGQGRSIVLSLGANLGDRLGALQRAIELLCQPGVAGRRVSGVYETAPVGGPPQDDYLNAVLLADSALPAADILARCQAAEEALHRVRTRRWGPRTLDADIIACGDERSADPRLTLPHPRAHQRAFVLAPWLEADPDAVLPGHGPVAALLAVVGTQGVRRLDDLVLRLPEAAGEVAS